MDCTSNECYRTQFLWLIVIILEQVCLVLVFNRFPEAQAIAWVIVESIKWAIVQAIANAIIPVKKALLSGT